MEQVSRRAFACILGTIAIGAPNCATAQASKVIRRIGWLDVGTPDTPEDLSREAEPLRALGWIEGQNLHVERRYDNGRPEALPSLAEELVRAQVELLVTFSSPATLAAKRATTTIPIIFGSAADPVGLGLVASLSQPGGNVTGFSLIASELTAKRLSILKELLPNLRRVAFLWERDNPIFRSSREHVEMACHSVGIEAIFADYGGPAEIDSAIEWAARGRAQALVVSNDRFSGDHALEIFRAATRLGLPTMATDARFGATGSLLSYSFDRTEQLRVIAEYIDRVLRGARPADLPVRQPTRFELVINLRAARGLRLAVSRQLLVQATKVIE